MKSPT